MATMDTHVCIHCKEEKDREGFYKKQWKLSDKGLCKLCFEEKQTAANNKRKLKKAAKESRKKQKRQLSKEEMKEKQEYYMVYGVGYETPQPHLFQYKNEPLANESLLGAYELVFYSSTDTDAEDIHRTARGTLTLAMKEWNGKPALWGRYSIDTSQMGCSDAKWPDDSWGTHPNPSFIQVPNDWTPPDGLHGSFDIFSSESYYPEDDEKVDEFCIKQGRKHFMLDREGFTNAWWSILEGDTSNVDFDREHTTFCSAVMKVVAKTHALGLAPNEMLPEVEFHPARYNHVPTRHELAETPNNLELADKLMTAYRDGNSSWMCQHLDVPAVVAFKIREYVTPPPAFYVKEGDIMLVVEECNRPEWQKELIFRKIV